VSTRALSMGRSGWGMALTTLPHAGIRLRMSRAISLDPSVPSTAC